MAVPMANGPPFATLNHVAADLGIPNESEPLRVGINHASSVKSIGVDPNAYQAAHDTFKEDWGSGYKELLAARAELITAARSLLVEIMGVDKHQ